MAKAKSKTRRKAYIETRPGVRRAAPVIAGTGIKMVDVAVRYEVMGMTAEEIIVALPHQTSPRCLEFVNFDERSAGRTSRSRCHANARVDNLTAAARR